jgi:hypothetical protein
VIASDDLARIRRCTSALAEAVQQTGLYDRDAQDQRGAAGNSTIDGELG